MTVAADETASLLTVKVTSVKAPALSAEARVTVYPAVTDVTRENIVLHYIFDGNADDAVVKDYSKNGYDGVMNGSANWTGDGFAFGEGNYIELPGAELVSTSMTLIYRLKRTADEITGSSLFWGKAAGGWNQNGIWANIPDESTPLHVAADGWAPFTVQASVSEFYPKDEWTEVAITVDSIDHTYAVYRNGELVASGSNPAISVTPAADSANMIGSAGAAGNEQLHGVTMDKYMIFDKALTAENVKAVYDGRFDPGAEPPAHEHTLTYVEAEAPTETENGNIAYWYCGGCQKYFADEAATQEISQADTVIPALGHRHTLTYVEAKAPTYSEEGNIAYWYCQGCGRYYRDADCTMEITLAETIIPRLGYDLPITPVVPVTPVTPVTPNAPSTPGTSSKPGTTDTPSTPSTPNTTVSDTKVTTDSVTDSGTVVTETTAIPDTVVQDGTAVSTVTAEIGQEIVNQAVSQESEKVIIAPEMPDGAAKTEVAIPANTLGEIASKTDAELQISTPVASVILPNQALSDLAAGGGQVAVTAEKTGSTVEVTVTANGKKVETVSGGMTVNIPQADCGPGTVAMLVHEDGSTTVVRQSIASGDGQSVTVPLDGSATVMILDNSVPLGDVPASSWAADAVAFVTSHEVMSGTGEGVFNPAASMTRGMLAMVLHNLENNPASTQSSTFSDVSDDAWYARAVCWAAEKGIVTGYANGTFGPSDPITREQLAVMLYRYAGSPAVSASIDSFADAGKVSGYAKTAVAWAVANGVMNGKGNATLDPQGTATRAEVAQMLMNFMSSGVK